MSAYAYQDFLKNIALATDKINGFELFSNNIMSFKAVIPLES